MCVSTCVLTSWRGIAREEREIQVMQKKTKIVHKETPEELGNSKWPLKAGSKKTALVQEGLWLYMDLAAFLGPFLRVQLLVLWGLMTSRGIACRAERK